MKNGKAKYESADEAKSILGSWMEMENGKWKKQKGKFQKLQMSKKCDQYNPKSP
jgi:hypothetical protein